MLLKKININTFIKLIFVLLLSILAILTMTACTNNNNSNNKIVIFVDFETNGGTYVESIRTENFVVQCMPKNPTKEHYSFGGWFADNGSFLIPFTVNTLQNYPLQENTPERRITVYAKWIINKHTIIFDYAVNGNTSLTQDWGTKINSSPTPQIEGYEFLGWYADSLYSEKIEFPYTVDKNAKFYAKLQKEKYYITLYNKKTNMTILENWFNYGDSIDLTYQNIEGYIKNGWTSPKGLLEEKNNFKVIDFGKNNINVILNTNYVPKQYTINFYLNKNNAEEVFVKESKYDEIISISTPTWVSQDLIFAGWFDSVNGGNLISENSSFKNNFILENNATLNLYAQWRKKLYTFEFYYNDHIEYYTYQEGQTIHLPVLNEEGLGLYNCNWSIFQKGANMYLDRECILLGTSNQQITIEDYGTDKTKIKIKIIGEKERYTLSVNGSAIRVSKGSIINLEVPDAEDGYKFVGYYSEKNGNGTFLGYDTYTVGDLGENDAGLTLFAYFEKIEN